MMKFVFALLLTPFVFFLLLGLPKEVIILLIILVPILIAVNAYNKFVKAKNQIQNAFAGMDVQLKKKRTYYHWMEPSCKVLSLTAR